MAARRKVGADFTLSGNSVDRPGNHAVNQHDPLVSAGNFPQECLRHKGFAPDLPEQFGQCGEVLSVGADMDDSRSGIAVKRLDDDFAMLLLEGTHFRERPRNQGRRHELRIIENEDFFRRVADADRIIDHKRVALDAFKQMGGRDITQVERRVLAHQDDIDTGPQIKGNRIAQPEMVAHDPLHHFDRVRLCPNAAIGIVQGIGSVLEAPISALLGRKHQGKS